MRHVPTHCKCGVRLFKKRCPICYDEAHAKKLLDYWRRYWLENVERHRSDRDAVRDAVLEILYDSERVYDFNPETEFPL